ncbi:MAG: DUF5686 family protein [Prolixibacteraceae bacterium]
MKRITSQILALLLCCTLLFTFNAKANSADLSLIKGKVIDANTSEPIPFVNIVFVDTNLGTISDVDGDFSLHSSENGKKVKFSSVGYETIEIQVVLGEDQTFTIQMNPKMNNLDEVSVRPKKIFYRNKNNPAVDLIRNVIENKTINRKENFDSYTYEKYEKIQFALSDLSDKFIKRKAFRKFQFVFDNIDTTKIEGVKVLPIYLKETLSDYYYQKEPAENKDNVKATKMVSFDGYVNDEGVSQYLNYLYQDIDIYSNNIPFVTNLFLSPIANSATAFYQYFIQDTSIVDGSRCVKLFYTPRNKTDMLFQGNLFVAIDENYAIKRLEMSVNKNINLNWVKDVKIVQDFKHIDDSGWLLSSDEISIDFGLSKRSMGIYGQRTVSFKNYKINESISDSVFNDLNVVNQIDETIKSDDYWETHRHKPLEKSEIGTYAITDSIQNIPAFKKTMNTMVFLIAGYKDFGKFELGPVNTFYSYNPTEGVRLRMGGRTTPKFSEKLNFETYLAYGFYDQKPKYYLSSTYSLTDQNIYQFPVKSIKVSVQNETKIPGQELDFVQEDNVLLSIKRGENNKLLYNKMLKIEHLNEFDNHFSYSLSYCYNRQSPGGILYFKPSKAFQSAENVVDHINISELSLSLRYAPHEQFYQGKTYRKPIANKYPIWQFQYTAGLKALGNDYNYQSLKLKMYKRFYLGVLGYSDTMWELGKIYGTVDYPLLTIHRANQTYAYQLASYNLMNFLEFVSDQYVSVNIDHYFNGFFFNKIPVLKNLKLREVVSAKVLYGSISDRNNPALNSDLFMFPTDQDGSTTTFSLERKPYVEVSAGITNIFKFLRVDVVKRLTYLDNPTVNNIGIRARFRFDF